MFSLHGPGYFYKRQGPFLLHDYFFQKDENNKMRKFKRYEKNLKDMKFKRYEDLP